VFCLREKAIALQEHLNLSDRLVLNPIWMMRWSNRGRCDRLVKMVLFGSQARGDADYGQLNAVTAQQANEQITRAEQFLELADNLIGTIPPNS
jgi:uncharacterized protein (UPF0332 family)